MTRDACFGVHVVTRDAGFVVHAPGVGLGVHLVTRDVE